MYEGRINLDCLIMNKYSSLKINNLEEFPIDEFYLTCNSLRSAGTVGNISALTMNQNLSHSRSTFYFPAKESFSFPELCRTAMPSSRNFSELLNKLDLVSSPKLNKCQALSENDQLDIIIEENSYCYLMIPVKGRPSPLRVNLKKSQGKVVIYSSFTQEKPSHLAHDSLFTADSFEIRTLDLNFRQESVYLGVKATIFSKLSISCSFGKKNGFVLDKRLKKKEVAEKVHQVKASSVKNLIKRPESKNFIGENLKRISPRRQIFSSWEEKRQKAVMKKKMCLLEKKEKAINFINRQKIRREQNLIERARIEAILLKTNQVKDWLVFLYILKATSQINSIRNIKRSEKSRILTKKTKVRTIQRFFRQTTKNFSVDKIVALRSHLLISFFYHITKPITIKETHKMLISQIRNSGVVHKPQMKISSYIKKIESIQLSFRKYLGVKAERIRKLIIFWDECKSFQTRRSVKKKSLIHELNISIHQRSVVLTNYYRECLREFYESLKAPGIFISQSGLEKKRMIRTKVGFHYMPTLIRMKQLIEAASLVPDRIATNEDSPIKL